MERWTFDIIADGSGAEAQIRMYLRTGDDQAAWPVLQVGLDGTEVATDAAPKDYEAPEWKALQLFTAGGGTDAQWEGLKDRLRAQSG